MIILLFVLLLIFLIVIILCKRKSRSYFTNEKEVDLYTFLLNYKNKHIIYIPNPGNAGDALIAHSTFTLFDKMNINYDIGLHTTKYKDKILFYGGGGNLVGVYKDCEMFLKNNMHDNKIVLLPHTIKDVDSLIKNFGDNVIVLCRERKSFDYVSKLIKNKSNVFISKDLALYIKVDENFKNKKSHGILNCFRKDVEKTNKILPDDNIDLSNELYIINNQKSYKKNVENISHSIFDYLSNYDTINTNRLHMAIAGSLLNKNVNMYPNNYFKNTSVYTYSLKNFRNTKFH